VCYVDDKLAIATLNEKITSNLPSNTNSHSNINKVQRLATNKSVVGSESAQMNIDSSAKVATPVASTAKDTATTTYTNKSNSFTVMSQLKGVYNKIVSMQWYYDGLEHEIIFGMGLSIILWIVVYIQFGSVEQLFNSVKQYFR
jgi:hypothetical protein